METLTITDEVAKGLHNMANQLGLQPTQLLEKALQQFLREEASKKISQEEQYFRQQLSQLLAEYADQYIAMHNGQIIDSDANELELYLRIREKYPYTGILLKKVTPQTEEVWHVRSPRIKYH